MDPYRSLVAATAITNLGDGIVRVWLPVAAVAEGASPATLATLGIGITSPWLLCSAPAGFLVDRHGYTRVVSAGVGARVLLLAVAVAAGVAGMLSVPAIFVLALLSSTLEVFTDVGSMTALPDLVAPAALPTANRRLFAVNLVSDRFAGPALGGALTARSGDLAGAAGCVAYLTSLRYFRRSASGVHDRAVTGPSGSVPSRWTDVVRTFRTDRALLLLVIMVAGLNVAKGAAGSVLVAAVVSPGPLGLSARGFGLLTAVGGIGAVAAATAHRRAPGSDRTVRRQLAVSAAAMAAAVAAPGVTTSVVLVALVFAAGGAGEILWSAIVVSYRQRVTPRDQLGRVNAIFQMIGAGAAPLGALAAALSVGTIGLRPLFVVAGLLSMSVCTLLRWLPSLDLSRADDGAVE